LQRLTVKPIEDQAEQAAIDERLKRGEEAVSGGGFPIAQADAGKSHEVLGGTKQGSTHRSTSSRRSARKRRGRVNSKKLN
jgi:hypothetical protein